MTARSSLAPRRTDKLHRPVNRLGGLAWSLVLPVALVVGYDVWAGRAGNPYFPPLERMVTAFVQTWGGEGFIRHVVPSLWNLARGYALGLVLGTLGGVAIGRLPRLRAAADPVIYFIMTIPAVALLPVFLIFFGVTPRLQVGMIATSVFFYVLITTANAIRGLEPILIETSAVFRISGWRRVLLVYIPAAVPEIISAARVTLGIAVLVMVVSEMSGASRGIGAVTLLSQQSFDYDTMWAGMLLLAAIGIGLNLLFAAAERRILAGAGYRTPSPGRAR